MTISNKTILEHNFLAEMYEDDYFPNFLVDKAKQILLDLCQAIEQQQPGDLSEQYSLTHAATERINQLEAEFEANDSEIETAARECFGDEFYTIANAYGFADADGETLIATRDWCFYITVGAFNV